MTTVERAIQFAVFAHAGTKRKGKERPYILHPIEAMTIAASLTEDEDVLAAAVLHDVIEDTNLNEEDIEREFGPRVKALVMAESEDKMKTMEASFSWKLRKQATIDHLKGIDREAKMICLGDKLANLREIARDYRQQGDALWSRFNQKDKNEHAWYYRSVFEILAEAFKGESAIAEYRALLKEVFES